MHGGLCSKLCGACAQNERVVWAWLDRRVSAIKSRRHKEADNLREPMKTVELAGQWALITFAYFML